MAELSTTCVMVESADETDLKAYQDYHDPPPSMALKATDSCAAVDRGREYSLSQISTMTFLNSQFSNRLGQFEYVAKNDLIQAYSVGGENTFETSVSLLWAMDKVATTQCMFQVLHPGLFQRSLYLTVSNGHPSMKIFASLAHVYQQLLIEEKAVPSCINHELPWLGDHSALYATQEDISSLELRRAMNNINMQPTPIISGAQTVFTKEKKYVHQTGNPVSVAVVFGMGLYTHKVDAESIASIENEIDEFFYGQYVKALFAAVHVKLQGNLYLRTLSDPGEATFSICMNALQKAIYNVSKMHRLPHIYVVLPYNENTETYYVENAFQNFAEKRNEHTRVQLHMVTANTALESL
ncbi:hypothetical protein PSACC_01372 [Paramicrosporidium saccamoebae]|uniref:Uncharacterized protein n=1 Tax=Paramicrosporidium saccamoebae TaxID=1246581 RepID=A0A2H9TMB9_9FUNG|nr:hypothetical protein PSACC_01372 [Paramicrosporidium saccamoebae]